MNDLLGEYNYTQGVELNYLINLGEIFKFWRIFLMFHIYTELIVSYFNYLKIVSNCEFLLLFYMTIFFT